MDFNIEYKVENLKPMKAFLVGEGTELAELVTWLESIPAVAEVAVTRQNEEFLYVGMYFSPSKELRYYLVVTAGPGDYVVWDPNIAARDERLQVMDYQEFDNVYRTKV